MPYLGITTNYNYSRFFKSRWKTAWQFYQVLVRVKNFWNPQSFSTRYFVQRKGPYRGLVPHLPGVAQKYHGALHGLLHKCSNVFPK